MGEPKREQDRERYKRHFMLPQVGEEGQRKLEQGKVLVVGAGGLGSPAALYLAAAGVGTIGIADFDRVDVSNLQRQILYREQDVGRRKAEAAEDCLRRRNRGVTVRRFEEGITPENAEQILGEFDVVVDATDRFPIRYLLSDVCRKLGKPDVYGAICQFAGQVTVFAPGGPCLRCLCPEAPDPAAEPDGRSFGVLGAVPGVVGSLQAVEALKLLLGVGEPLSGRLLLLDLLAMRTEEVALPANPRCRCQAAGNSGKSGRQAAGNPGETYR